VKITSARFIKGITGNDAVLYDGKPQIAFIGRSNVGKSTVINSLMNKGELAKTGKKQGKTTEVNFFLVNDKMYFVDLPGYGFAQGSKVVRESIRAMIVEYLTRSGKKPHTVVVILDAKVGLTDFDRDVLDILQTEGHHAIILVNKIDKLNQRELAAQVAAIRTEAPEVEVVEYSAIEKKRSAQVLNSLTL
jgi:GTP-binding protein